MNAQERSRDGGRQASSCVHTIHGKIYEMVLSHQLLQSCSLSTCRTLLLCCGASASAAVLPDTMHVMQSRNANWLCQRCQVSLPELLGLWPLLSQAGTDIVKGLCKNQTFCKASLLWRLLRLRSVPAGCCLGLGIAHLHPCSNSKCCVRRAHQRCPGTATTRGHCPAVVACTCSRPNTTKQFCCSSRHFAPSASSASLGGSGALPLHRRRGLALAGSPTSLLQSQQQLCEDRIPLWVPQQLQKSSLRFASQAMALTEGLHPRMSSSRPAAGPNQIGLTVLTQSISQHWYLANIQDQTSFTASRQGGWSVFERQSCLQQYIGAQPGQHDDKTYPELKITFPAISSACRQVRVTCQGTF